MFVYVGTTSNLIKLFHLIYLDLPFIVLESKNKEGDPVKLRVRPEPIAKALAFLKQHNPGYKEVVISDENLNFYKSNGGVVTGLPVIHQVILIHAYPIYILI